MATQSKNTTIRFIIEGNNKVIREMNKLSEKLDKVSRKNKKVTETGLNTNKMMGSMSTMAGGAAYRLTAFVRLIQEIPGPLKALAIAFLGVGAALKKMTSIGAKAETGLIAMEVILGSKEKALSLQKQALEFARKTQFTPSDMRSATTKAVTYGLRDPFMKGLKSMEGEMVSQMDVLASLASLPGMDEKALGMKRMMNAVMSGNRKALKPIIGLIDKARDETMKTHKLNTASWGPALIKNIAKMTRVFSLAKKQANSIAGAWSTIAGYADEMAISFSGVYKEGDTWVSAIRGMLISIRDTLRPFVEFIAPFLSEMGSFFGSIVTFIVDIIRAVWTIVGPLATFIGGTILEGFRQIFAVASGVFKILGIMIKGIANVVMAVLDLVLKAFGITSDLGAALKSITDDISNYITWIKILFMFMALAVEGEFEAATKYINSISDKFKKQLEIISYGWRNMIREWKVSLNSVFAMLGLKKRFNVTMSKTDIGIKNELYDKQKKEFLARQKVINTEKYGKARAEEMERGFEILDKKRLSGNVVTTNNNSKNINNTNKKTVNIYHGSDTSYQSQSLVSPLK